MSFAVKETTCQHSIPFALFRASSLLRSEVLKQFEALNKLEGVRNPLPVMYDFYVLIETTGSDESYDREKLEKFLFGSMESSLISDGVIAKDSNQVSSFWRIREGIPEALMKSGAVYKYDLSLPVEKMYNLVEEMWTRLVHSWYEDGVPGFEEAEGTRRPHCLSEGSHQLKGWNAWLFVGDIRTRLMEILDFLFDYRQRNYNLCQIRFP